ncbi:MAG: tRNA (adenosine(37)-N6)-threonylcarbamoyltransferase complex dimerization subunit type 1 TsaB [Phycisphaerae bacterium]|nr:tRNA (adenosine(37)-N6)-threonylcarbamoyltransferase complex dimerization subunit type 1 TsaB [Phycisphaerae bacterium]
MNTTKIIAIETSGRCGSVALAEGPTLLEEALFAADQEHARDLLPIIDRLTRNQGWHPDHINHCYVSIGPGSFTGLRVAVTFARHLAMTTGAKICDVPTLDVVARNGLDLKPVPNQLAVVLDAKRRQVFGAIYELEGDGYRRAIGPLLIEPAALLATVTRELVVVGEGVPYHEAALRAGGVIIGESAAWRPRAAQVHRLGWNAAQRGQFTASNELVPMYVRRPEAEEIWEKRTGAGQSVAESATKPIIRS